MTNVDSVLKSRDNTLATNVHLVKAMVFPVVMYGCEGWTIKKAEHWRTDAFWTMLLEKTLESPLGCKEIKPVSPKGNQSWIFIRRTDAETDDELTHRKDPDAGKDWRWEEKGMTEGEIVGWHHKLNGHEFKQTLGDTEGQGSLACYSSWGRKESDTTEWLIWSGLIWWHLVPMLHDK